MIGLSSVLSLFRISATGDSAIIPTLCESYARFSLLTLIILFGCMTSQASSALALSDGTVNINLSSVLSCTTIPRQVSNSAGSPENLYFHHLQRQKPNWQPNNRSYVDPPFSMQSYWCKVELENTGSNYRWVASLNNTRLNYVNFYWVNQGDSLPSQIGEAGDSLGKNTASKISAYPTFHFSLPQGNGGTLYFAVDTNSVGWMRPMLYSSDAFGAHMAKRRLWQWSYFGMLLFVVALRWFLTPLRVEQGITSARIHLYLCLAVFCGAGYLFHFYGDTSLWLRGVSGEFKNTLLFVFNLGLQVFVLAFFKVFLGTKALSSILNRFYSIHTSIIFVLVGSVILLPQYNMPLVKLTALAAMITVALAVAGTLIALRRGKTWVWPLALSWLSIAFCGGVLALVFLDVLPYNDFTGYALLWVFPLDVLLLFTAVFSRQRQLQKEVVQLKNEVETQREHTLRSAEKINVSAIMLEENIEKEEPPSKDLESEKPACNNDSEISKESPLNTNSGEAVEKRLKGIDAAIKVKELKSIFEVERLYLDENIKLASVAAKLQLRPDQVSAIVNRELGVSFSTLVNEYRIHEAKKLMREKPNETLLNIAVSSGFNSRASFNRVFKVHEKITPAEFRKNIYITTT